MEKPRAFIHLDGGGYRKSPCLVIGRWNLPLPVMFAGAGLIFGSLLVYAIVASSLIGWVTWSAFSWPLGFLIFFVGLWVIIGLVNLIAWMVRETVEAN